MCMHWMKEELIILSRVLSKIPVLLWQVCCSCCGRLVITITAKCIALFLCWTSMKYSQSGLEINTIYLANCGPNLTVEIKYVYSSCLLGNLERGVSSLWHPSEESVLVHIFLSYFSCSFVSLSTNQPHPVFCLIHCPNGLSLHYSQLCRLKLSQNSDRTICSFLYFDVQAKNTATQLSTVKDRRGRLQVLLRCDKKVLFFPISRYAASSASAVRKLSSSGELEWTLATEQWSPVTQAPHHIITSLLFLRLWNTPAAHFYNRISHGLVWTQQQLSELVLSTVKSQQEGNGFVRLGTCPVCIPLLCPHDTINVR